MNFNLREFIKDLFVKQKLFRSYFTQFAIISTNNLTTGLREIRYVALFCIPVHSHECKRRPLCRKVLLRTQKHRIMEAVLYSAILYYVRSF